MAAPSRSGFRSANGITIPYERPWLYQKQTDAIFGPERYAVVEASSKSGKTVGCMAWLTEQAALHGRPGRNYWWVAPVYPQSHIAYRRIMRGLPPSLYTANESAMTLTLANETTIWFKTGERPDALYGEDVYAAVIDEATRVREESWYAVRSTLTATRGPVRIIGNVKGRKNWAYKLARKAEAGEPDHRYTKITAYDAVDAGVLDAAEIEDAKRQLPVNVFNELYLAEPSDDGGNPFGMDAIGRCVAPLSDAPPVCWGVDLAKSVDWTVAIGLDRDGRVCRFERWQAPWEETTERLRSLLGTTRALVDSTGVGDPILERLQRGGRWMTEGHKFTASSKQQLMEGLAVAIQQQEIGYPDGVIRLELESFEYVYSRSGVHYAGAEGMHDDTVCALALAVAHRPFRRLHTSQPSAAVVDKPAPREQPITPRRPGALVVGRGR